MLTVRVSESVIAFKDKVLNIWGLDEWGGIDDPDVLFFGMYNDRDWDTFWRFKGKKTIFWCGSDILRLISNPEGQRILRLYPETEHWCETEEEAKNLRSVGIEPKVAPSFLEYIDDFPVSFKPSEYPHIWMCAHPNREEEYGIYLAREIADRFPEYTFHFYGIEGKSYDNVIYHGKVPNEQFNKEIRKYHCGLRCNEHDGNSEVPMKSVLLGQYPITRMKYDKLWQYETKEELEALLEKLSKMKEPNYEARSHWIKKINQYPWCKREYWREKPNENSD